MLDVDLEKNLFEYILGELLVQLEHLLPMALAMVIDSRELVAHLNPTLAIVIVAGDFPKLDRTSTNSRSNMRTSN